MSKEQKTIDDAAEGPQKKAKFTPSVQGWKLGDKVLYTGPTRDSREFGYVVKIEKLPPHVTVKWDIGKAEAYYIDDAGHLFNSECSGNLEEKWIVGERTAPDPKVQIDRKAKDVDILRTGTQIILPPGMSLQEGITWLTRKQEADEKEVAIYEEIEAFPLEGAYAFKRALDRVYGFSALVNTPGMFGGSNPPVMVGVEVGLNKTEQIPWGRLSVPGIAGYFQTSMTHKDGKFKFVIGGVTKQKHKNQVAELAALVRTIVEEESIYRGKAIRVTFDSPEEIEEKKTAETLSPFDNMPKFMDLAGVRPGDLIFPDNVARLVETAVFTPLRKRSRCALEGIPFKRGVILEGPWGVGKTLTANVTAKICEENGITFIYLEDVERLEEALRFAALNQPAVVFAEDIDQVAKDGRYDEDSPLNDILNIIDGVEMKSAAVMVVLTTNYIGNVEQALLRPGRIDAVIPVRPPDAAAATRLIDLYARGRLAPGTNLAAVGAKLAGQIPAVIREVVERAKLEGVGRIEDGSPLELTNVDLERAADSMLEHLKLLEPRAEDKRTPYERGAQILAAAIKERNSMTSAAEDYLAAAVDAATGHQVAPTTALKSAESVHLTGAGAGYGNPVNHDYE